jgi:hypothetical protein
MGARDPSLTGTQRGNTLELEQIERLEKLAGLKAKGAISEDEFKLEKIEILKPRPPPSQPVVSPANAPSGVQGTYWFPIPSLVLGIFCVLALLDDSDWDKDTINGMIIFSAAGLILGIVAITRQKKGLGMAIAGVVMSSLTLLVTLLQ